MTNVWILTYTEYSLTVDDDPEEHTEFCGVFSTLEKGLYYANWRFLTIKLTPNRDGTEYSYFDDNCGVYLSQIPLNPVWKILMAATNA